MQALKNLGHSVVIGLLALLSYVATGAIPSTQNVLHMTVQGVLTLALTWAYVHFGITPPVTTA